jgi:DNA-binding beta-propeller fold protein YncE
MNHDAPTGLAVDEAGRIYVADLGANAVRVFDPQGRLLTRFFGVYGAAAGEFRDLADVAVDSERGLLYAVDSINGRLQQFTLSLDANGVPTVTVRLVVGEYGREPGQFSYPQSVAVDPSSGRVYVADMGNQRIQAFDVEGTYLAAYRPAGVHLWQVMGVAVGADGTLYATDALNNLIWAFDPGGGPPRRIEPHP